MIASLVTAVVLAFVAAGCGGGGGGGNPIPTSSVISGFAQQGFMAGASVGAYSVNPANGSNGMALGRTTTDSTGFFTLRLMPHNGPLRLVVSAGAFQSEANGATISSPGKISLLLSAALAGPVIANVNPLTDFIDQMAMVRITKLGQNFSTALKNATSKVEQVFGLSSDPSQLTADYTSTGTDAAKLGLVLGAMINEDQTLCPTSPGGLVTALATDLADGAFDGKDANGNPVGYCGGSLAAIAGTSIFEDALSGLQQLQLVTRPFAFGGTNNLLTSNGLANIATGGSISYPFAPLGMINNAVGANAGPASVNIFAASTPDMNNARTNATATLLPNGMVFIAGGYSNLSAIGALFSTEIYDPATDTFAVSTPTMNTEREFATATLLRNGQVLIAGGLIPISFIHERIPITLASTEIYDPATNTFAASTPTMNSARLAATATLLPNGKVLIAGGLGESASLSNTEIYDPVTNTFAASTPIMNTARDAATATLLPNGKVLIAGGSGNSGPLSNTEIYDPTTNTFAASTPSMNDARILATATLLPNGKVLIAGGYNNIRLGPAGPIRSTEIYDSATNTFAASTPNMNTARDGATATLLPNGKVLIAGGFGGSDPVSDDTSSTEIYDSATNSFATSTPSMHGVRSSATATLLPNGKVLIAGGELIPRNPGVELSVLSSTEIYSP